MVYKKASCPICKKESKFLLTSGRDYEYSTSEDIFYMYLCKDCNHLYLNPRPYLKDFDRIYPDEYYSYNFTKKEGIAKLAKKFIEKRFYANTYKEYINKGRILDVGCGDGRLISVLKSINKNWGVFGVDFNKTAVEKARDKGFYIYEGKFEEVSIKERSFDLIIMNELLEHVIDPNEVIEKAYYILEPKGYIIIETPCFGSPDFKIFKDKYWGGYHFPRHINIFSRNSIKTLIEKKGFRIVKIQSLLSPPFWILSMHHLLLDKRFPSSITKKINFYNPFLLSLFTFIDLINIKTGGITSTMRVIAKKV